MLRKLQIAIIIVLASLLAACASDSADNSFATAQANFREQNYYNAYQQLLVPAAQGNPEAEYALGYLYYYGKGTPMNQTLGKQWILKAAKDGNTAAQQAYQMILAREQGVIPGQTQAMSSPAPMHHHYVRATPKRTPKAVKKAVSHSSLLTAPATSYTLQLIDTTSPAAAKAFISQHNLGAKAHYFHRVLNGKNLYVVVYGSYPSYSSAQKAVNTLPLAIQKLKPWARKMQGVQNEIRAAA